MAGTRTDGQKTAFWLRWTACFSRTDGRWLVTHEHVSVPVDFTSGMARFDLQP